MALTGNKGEWGEIYTLLKLLGEGKVYAGDRDLNKIQNLFKSNHYDSSTRKGG